jgi:hypothetical protein
MTGRYEIFKLGAKFVGRPIRALLAPSDRLAGGCSSLIAVRATGSSIIWVPTKRVLPLWLATLTSESFVILNIDAVGCIEV